MLEHALVINAQEQYQSILVTMAPHIKKEDRKKLLDNYREIIDGGKEVTSATIEADRKRLRTLLSGKRVI